MAEDLQLATPKSIPKIVLQTLIFTALLFVPAGTLWWWQGWVYIALSLIVGVAGAVWLNATNPELLKERMKPLMQPDQPRADKLATIAFAAASTLWFVFIPLDVFHLHLLPTPPMWVRWGGLALWAVSMWIMYLTFRENTFAAPVVKHQKSRQQRVVDTGPYAVVRHPLYSAVLLYAVAVALWLGSTAGVLLVVLPLAALVARIGIEEKYLAQHLPRYADYLHRLRWRIVPYVW